MNNVKLWDLRTLQPRFAEGAQQASNEADYFSSPEFLASVAAIERSPAEQARLTIALLRHIALDPSCGSTVDDHIPLRGGLFKTANGAPQEIYFALAFHRVSNFLGYFTLPADAPEAKALLEAIEANLASRKFKAAKMERRLQANVPCRYRRFQRRAELAYDATYAQAEKGAPAWKPFDNAVRCQFYEANVYPAARAASDAVLVPLQDRLLNRLQAVANAAFDDDFRGSYTDARIAFVKRYIAPAKVANG